MSEASQNFSQTDGAEPAMNRARSLRAYSRNQQIAVENMIARQENELILPKKADWHSLLTRTV
jgi:hypothetical protein